MPPQGSTPRHETLVGIGRRWARAKRQSNTSVGSAVTEYLSNYCYYAALSIRPPRRTPHLRDHAPPQPAPPRAETLESPRDGLPKMPGQNEKEAVPSKDQVDAQVKSADMSDEMQQEAIEIAQEAMLKFNIEKDIAQHIKKTFDDRKGPTWHCIVGRNFGSFVTHETKHFIYFYLGHCAILLFKTQ
ncbi:hypothetical protein V499_04920 [Pseudogymnoascus sp. VKM F-103]|nr:hypothetical protein V499_04920 [Pseudogymnoascus sp. VKM F-103]